MENKEKIKEIERQFELKRIELQLKMLETEKELIDKMPRDILLKVNGFA